MMNNYELAIVINAKVNEETRVATIEKINDYIAKAGATVSKVDEWGKRRLAYEIEKVREGFYYIYTIEANADFPAEIEARLRIMEPVLRYLTVKLED